MAKIDKFKRLLNKHKTVAIDTMVFIYHFEESRRYTPLTLVLFGLLEKGKIKGTTSVLTKLEILVKPKQEGETELAKTYEHLLDTFPGLSLRSMESSTAELASTFRAKYGISTPDAIQVASALEGKATLFITNDEALKKVKEISVAVLKNLL